MSPLPPSSSLFPYTTLFRSKVQSPINAENAHWLNQNTRFFVNFPNYSIGGAFIRIDAATWSHPGSGIRMSRSEEHTSELQSQSNLVCRLLLEKTKTRHRRLL